MAPLARSSPHGMASGQEGSDRPRARPRRPVDRDRWLCTAGAPRADCWAQHERMSATAPGARGRGQDSTGHPARYLHDVALAARPAAHVRLNFADQEDVMTPGADDRELKWRQYELLVNFTEHGLELALKASVFYFAVTGAMLSFYASQPDPTKLVLRLSLLLPLAMGVCFMLVSGMHAFST